MIETKENEAMVQDQNLPAPQTGAEQNENHVTMESQEQIPGVQPLRDAIEGESQAAEVPATESPAVESEAEPTPESTEEEVDGTTTTATTSILEKRKIYSFSELEKLGVRLARIVDNRDLDEKAVLKKINSIKKVKGVISPTQLVPARTCLEQGHEVKLLDGTGVSEDTEDLDNIYVIVDGQHRDEAVRKIKNNPKEAVKYENY